MKKILVIKSHPREESFCNALTERYIAAVKQNQHKVQILNLRELKLEKYIKDEHSTALPLGSDLKKAQELISWADHLTFTYPTWWSTAPALLKVFFEKVFESGFAFQYLESTGAYPKWEKYLKNKTARVISTMDSPPWYMKLIVGDPGGKMMKDIMNFTGVKLLGIQYFGSVKTSSKEKRTKWLKKAYQVGLKE